MLMLANEMKSSMSQKKASNFWISHNTVESKGLKMSYSRKGPQVGQSWPNILFLISEAWKVEKCQKSTPPPIPKGGHELDLPDCIEGAEAEMK